MKDKILYLLLIICLILLFLQISTGNKSLSEWKDCANKILKNTQQEIVNNKKNQNVQTVEHKNTANKNQINEYNLPAQQETNISKNQRKEVYGNMELILPNNPPELSYKTKKEILDLRKQYVQNSFFANPNYQPSEEIFGGIVDGKPWVKFSNCFQDDGTSNVDGKSYVGLFIANPSFPVLISYFYRYYENDNSEWVQWFCKNSPKRLLPYVAYYHKDKKEIEVLYPKLIKTYNNKLYEFTGLNAKDFGYRYMYIDKAKSSYNIKFPAKDNVSNQIYEIQDYIHLGNSCKVKGGCNNISPYQPYFEFSVDEDSDNSPKGSQLYIKLWKNKPVSPDADADLAEKMMFY